MGGFHVVEIKKMNLQEFDSDELPQHIAVIMDGNGRWAQQQGKNRLRGHEAGTKAVRKTVEAAAKLGIKHLRFMPFLLKTGTVQRQKFPRLCHFWYETFVTNYDL